MAPGRWLIVLLCLTLPNAAYAKCTIRHDQTARLHVEGHLLTVPVRVNGQPAEFLLDTGASRSQITPSAVKRLRISRDAWSSSTMRGVGGYQRSRDADIASLTLGNAALHRNRTDHDLTLAVGPIGRPNADPIDGLLGADILSAYDVEIDLGRMTLSLYTVNGCTDKRTPWQLPSPPIPAIRPAPTLMLVPVVIDHHVLLALLDTGSNVSVITATGMRRLGLDKAALDGDEVTQVTGIGSGTVGAYRHLFAQMTIGSEVDKPVHLWVAPIHMLPVINMIIGLDWLSGHRLWISYTANQVLIGHEHSHHR